MDAWSIFIFIVFVASIPVATEMARERGRSRRFWFWIAFFAGPLAPRSAPRSRRPTRSRSKPRLSRLQKSK